MIFYLRTECFANIFIVIIFVPDSCLALHIANLQKNEIDYYEGHLIVNFARQCQHSKIEMFLHRIDTLKNHV